jgi:ABC-2 type transport system permease protein
MGAMFAAVGAAVTDYREANALFTPISATLFIPFVLLIVVMENPASIIARVFSYVPFTTPFVMAMRISQPAHPIPLWEIFATMVVGFAGVALVVWAAAKIFRTGALKYGKPPSFMGLLKWVKEA